jgi:hypothetical protein
MLRRFLAAEERLRHERELTDIERKRQLTAELPRRSIERYVMIMITFVQ